MAKGGNEKAKANGHEIASYKFANGYLNNGAPNENASKGLGNAQTQNLLVLDQTKIDFDTGIIDFSSDVFQTTGTYSEDGYTLDFSTNIKDWGSFSPSGTPVFDADFDGDLEFGANRGDVLQPDLIITNATMTNADHSSFSLESFDIQLVDAFGINSFTLSFTTYDDHGHIETFTMAKTDDNETWVYEVTEDGLTTSGHTSDEAEIAALFDNVETLNIGIVGSFVVDDIFVS